MMDGRFVAAVDGVAGLGGAFLRASGGFGARFQAVLGSAAGQRDVFAILRLVKPVLPLKRNLIACYEADGCVVVSRAADFQDVLNRQAEFAVVYGPRMRELTGGRDFFLGIDDGPDYRRNTEALARIVRPADLAPLAEMARREAAAATAGHAIDLPPALSARVPARMVQQYFGVAMETDPLIADATAMFHYLFADLSADPAVTERAMLARDRVNAAIDASMDRAGPETLLGRAVAAGAAGEPAFDRTGIRANLIGLIIGAIPTLSKAAVFAVEELLRRPDALAGARAAAQAGDEAALAAFLWEALRFNPVSPILYRRAVADTTVGGRPVKQGAMVLIANLSAMHDGPAVPQPARFQTPRPWESYCLWGEGLHRCWGDRINQALLPAMLAPLLAKPGLRAPGAPEGDTPFPSHYRLRWDG